MRLVPRHLVRAVAMLVPLTLLVLGFPSPAYAASSTVTLTGPGTVNENAGTATFTIAYTGTGATFSVDYATAGGTAVAPDDYTATSGTASFTPATTTTNVNVPIVDDALNEAAETFGFTISLAGGAPPTVSIQAPASATTSITDDDPVPSVGVTNAPSVTEGDAGTTTLTFDVGLSVASGQTVTVDWATADGTATAPSDYTAGNGILTFLAGDTVKTVDVTVEGDTLNEADETVALDLSNATNASLGSSGTGTILDDDPSPNLSIGDAGTVTEGDSGTVQATFAVTLDAASGRTVTVDWATANGTATTADADYIAGNGMLTFDPGQTSKSVTVTLNGDTTYETDETFTVVLSNPSDATVPDGTGQATIGNDDAAPSISIADATPVAEGDAGTTTATFTVTLTGATELPAGVDWTTGNGTATVADADYVAGNGTLTFDPGETSKSVTVTLNGDAIYETDETFTVVLSNPSGATIGTATGTGTITNDDALPTLSIANATPVAEGDSGTTTTTLTATLSSASALPVTADWATKDGTATVADADYVAGNGTLNFASGETSKSVTVTLNGDTTYERKEGFSVVLSNVSGASLGTSAATAAISNDDPKPGVSIGDASVLEGDGGTTELTFTLTLVGATALPAVVRYVTSGGTATADGDYTAVAGTLTFAVGDTSKTVTVAVNGDTAYEPNETLFVDLTAVSDVQLLDGHAVGTIENDDPRPTRLTVKLVKKPAKIKARGTLAGGAVDGMAITVSLGRRTGGTWVMVAKRTVKTTNATGGVASYVAAFARPTKGTYRFTVRFKGDATHLKSSKSLRFTL